jgi:hypothetical protein
VSHKRYVGLLAHNQPAHSRQTTPLPSEVADLLVNRMIAERISQKVIRMLPPDSVFPVAKFCAETKCYIPEKLPPVEIEGTYFDPPDASDTLSTIPRMRNLPRYRETYGDNQLAASL